MKTIYRWSGDRSVLSVRSPAKINLYLEILGQRDDGYHEIDTLMQAISLADELEFSRRPGSDVRLTVSSDAGLDLPSGEDNLVLDAARSLEVEARERGMTERLCGVSIQLEKRIPMGAGLGGGSSNAAWTLLGLNRLWNLGLDVEALGCLAAGLGSDVKFFLYGGLARCRGRGEAVSPIRESMPFETLPLVLASPPFGAPTSSIYNELRASPPVEKPLTSSKSLATMNFEAIWSALRAGELCGNRLQEVAFRVLPELRELFDVFARAPFRIAQMTGSGSTLFGLCRDVNEAEGIAGRLREDLGRQSRKTWARQTRISVACSLQSWSANTSGPGGGQGS